MAEQLTPQQQCAVENRGGSLLVSAAAGSGKTKVLVDRLLRYITDPVDPANVDDFLIITFTEAAAAELRGKIAGKLTERIAEEPGNRHLQRQMQRLYLAQISTVHAFCSSLLRENAYRIDVPGDFRIAMEAECIELQSRAMEKVLEEAYANASNDPDFRALINTQGYGRDDRRIPQIVLKIYNSAICHADPDAWLALCLDNMNVSGMTDASETLWGKYLIDDLHDYLDLHIDTIRALADAADARDDMENPAILFRSIVLMLEDLRNTDTWDGIYSKRELDFGRLTFKQQAGKTELADQMRIARKACADNLDKKLTAFADDSQQLLADIQGSVSAIRGLITLVKRFRSNYDRFKRGRRVLDFNDLEHMALELLTGKKHNGPTSVAHDVSGRFREVMVDEYQDTNAVQDAIFRAITSQKNNCFMVGDVKQAIYQFRLADPNIFLSKYNTFLPAESAQPKQGRKVVLSSNFRSCGAVIDAVNDIFKLCMSKKLGGLDYGVDEALYEGIPHKALDEPEVELYGIDVQNDTYQEEAAFVAQRITELTDGTHYVREGDGVRPIRTGDIAILLRSPGTVGEDFRYELEKRGIHCVTEKTPDMLQAEEITVLRSLLQIIDNPLKDIPMLAVLTSCIFGFTADEIANIRLCDRTGSIYEAMQKNSDGKTHDFLTVFEKLREEARTSDLSQLLQYIFTATKLDCIFAAMSDGDRRLENIHAFCQIASSYEANGQYDILRFLEQLETMDARGIPSPVSADTANAVRLLSIHKSKGLEFPVVFVCAMSKRFSTQSFKEPVFCDKELGLGFVCVEERNRIKYPSLAKRAIAAKMRADEHSEDMRVLYVALTRARDRLIMTYADKGLSKKLKTLAMRTAVSKTELVTMDAGGIGDCVLLAALARTESGEFFRLIDTVPTASVSKHPWLVKVCNAPDNELGCAVDIQEEQQEVPIETVERLRKSLQFSYAYEKATETPSKLTATQLHNLSGNVAANNGDFCRNWRKPSFVQDDLHGTTYGSAVHAFMQYVCYDSCSSLDDIRCEIARLTENGHLTKQQGSMINCSKILAFFQTELGRKLQCGNVLREFQFSILEDSSKYSDAVSGEQILLQGVVDCALIESDGITIVDYKTDRVSEDTVMMAVERYRQQVNIYADALSRIYQLPIKAKQLYFFHLDRFVAL